MSELSRRVSKAIGEYKGDDMTELDKIVKEVQDKFKVDMAKNKLILNQEFGGNVLDQEERDSLQNFVKDQNEKNIKKIKGIFGQSGIGKDVGEIIARKKVEKEDEDLRKKMRDEIRQEEERQRKGEPVKFMGGWYPPPSF